MKRVDDYLSRKAQQVHPDVVVYCDGPEGAQVWTYERAGQEPLGLGATFQGAKAAIAALGFVQRARLTAAERAALSRLWDGTKMKDNGGA